jgi:hypothetical protein
VADPIDSYLRVGENRGNVEAARALDVHEEAVRRLNEPLQLVFPLLVSRKWLKEVSRHYINERYGEKKWTTGTRDFFWGQPTYLPKNCAVPHSLKKGSDSSQNMLKYYGTFEEGSTRYLVR